MQHFTSPRMPWIRKETLGWESVRSFSEGSSEESDPSTLVPTYRYAIVPPPPTLRKRSSAFPPPPPLPSLHINFGEEHDSLNPFLFFFTYGRVNSYVFSPPTAFVRISFPGVHWILRPNSNV